MENNIPVMTAADGPASIKVRKDLDLVALIDADYLKYHVTKDIYDWLEKEKKDLIEVFGPDYLPYFVFKRIDETIMASINAKAYVFLFSDSSKKTFRYSIGFEKEYKGNRKASEDYNYENKFRDMAQVMHVVAEKYTMFIKPNLEADDLLSVFQNDKTFIYSYDKDSRTIPGNHWDIQKNQLINVTSSDALYLLCWQMLRGDTGDNIGGFPGMGEKKTADFIQEVPSVKSLPFRIFNHYVQKFGINEGIDRFCESWMLLKMRPPRGAFFLSKVEAEIKIINQLTEI